MTRADMPEPIAAALEAAKPNVLGIRVARTADRNHSAWEYPDGRCEVHELNLTHAEDPAALAGCAWEACDG